MLVYVREETSRIFINDYAIRTCSRIFKALKIQKKQEDWEVPDLFRIINVSE